jgi:staphylococcal nuclease domain-containing protein 1
MSPEPTLYAVKAVNSADMLVLLVPNKLPPVEKTVSLSNIDAPKLARRTGSPATDEPYAWEAREFVRKLLIGKTVRFQHEYSVEKLEREFGRVTLQDGTDVAQQLVAEGLAEVRHSREKKGAPESLETLEAAQEQAKAGKKGKWSSDPGSHHIRSLIWDPPEDIVSLSGNLSGQSHKVLVEQVLNGGLLRVLLLPSYQMVSLSLTGISCPAMRAGGSAGSPEPFAVEAKFFTERAILHREVNVLFEGYDDRNATNPYLFGSIVQGDKCFQIEPLERGLAQVSNWSIAKTQFAPMLRTAEANAKAKQLNRWRGYQPPPPVQIPDVKPPFTGRVVQINSGDTVTVIQDGTRASQKCTLASCKANRREEDEVVDGGHGAAARIRALPYRNWSWESREFLREKLIGKTVVVEPEYQRTVEGSGEVRCHCNILVEGENVALGLIEKGYAKVPPGRPEERSRYHEDYKTAETTATKAHAGLHGKQKSTELRIIDLVRPNPKKGHQYLTFLQGPHQNAPPRHRAIVEAVLNPCRYKVYVPSQNLAVTLALTGLTAPASGRDGSEAEPYAQEAFEFAKENYYHRDAEVEVESFDSSGTYYGSVFVNKDNVAVSLLREGFVQTNGNADKNRYHMALKAAQMEATREKRRIWAGEGTGIRGRISKKKAKARGAEIVIPTAAAPWESCFVTELVDLNRIYVQMLGDKNRQAMQRVQAALSAVDVSKKDAAPLNVNDIVAARFTADDTLYRARITRVDAAKVAVVYIDYGNSEVVGRDRVWTTAALSQLTESCPPQAQPLSLAFLAPMTDDSEIAQEAALGLRSFLQDFCDPAHPVMVRIEYTDSMKRKFATFKGGEGLAQEHLLRHGLARIESRWTKGEHAGHALWKDTVQQLVRVQEKAQHEKINLWQYGVVDSDEEY